MKTAGDIASEKGTHIISVPHDTSIHDALVTMIENKIGAVVVTRSEEPVGVWSSRDLMRNAVVEDFDPKTARIEDYMSSPILTAPSTDTSFELMDKFLGLHVNHLLVEQDGEYITMLSSGDVMKATIQEKTEELEELNTIVSWEYYEAWKWNSGRKSKA
jgi:signal-transduction protein with cAMP-binding, CBS, and nucleotidyltransferase domain